MEKKPPRPSTPQEEGIEFHPDAWERFKRTLYKVVKARPVHRTAKRADADHLSVKDRGHAKSSG
jgi:hypothetical protein